MEIRSNPGLEAVRCCLTDLSPIGRLSGSATVNCCSTEGWRWIAVLAQLALWTCWNETLTPWPGPPARTLLFSRANGAPDLLVSGAKICPDFYSPQSARPI